MKISNFEGELEMLKIGGINDICHNYPFKINDFCEPVTSNEIAFFATFENINAVATSRFNLTRDLIELVIHLDPS